MSLVDRVKNILVTPRTEWDVVAAESSPPAQVVTGYVLPLAVVAAIASFIGLVFIGQGIGMFGTVRMSIGAGVAALVMNVVMAVVMVFLVAFIIDTLAPSFGAQKNMNGAVRLVAYSYTPVWVVGVLAIIPALGLLGIVAAIYAIYLLYLGLPRIMKAPQEKAVGYTAVVIVVAIVVGFVIAMISGAVVGLLSPTGGFGRMGASPTVTFDRDSPAGKLDQMARKMEEAGKRIEQAQRSGDAKKQMEAAVGAIGTALSGGKGVDPVQTDALKPFVPDTFAGLVRNEVRADRSGVAGLMAAKVTGLYGQGDRHVRLDVVDTGGAAGLMGLAAWAAVGSGHESENADRVERMRRDGNRMVREEVSKRGGTDSYSVILADRFVVTAQGKGVGIDALKSGVASLDLGKIESLQ